ncbi:unnamed protein product [Leptosia nina]|uniref:Zinc finger DNA binding protein n=1 Tax=Leptosia nina TaxID=320188 RepID=A0AAV1J680_9NEOP
MNSQKQGSASALDDGHSSDSNKPKQLKIYDVDGFLLFRQEIKDMLCTFQKEQNDKTEKFFAQQNSRLDSLEKSISDLSSKLVTIDSTSQDIEKSMDFLSKQVDGIQNKIDGLQSQWKSVSADLQAIEDQQEYLAKSLNKTCLEVRNVPKTDQSSKSSLYDHVLHLCRSLKVSVNSNDIRDVTRVTNRKDTSKTSFIVELTNTLRKNDILNAVKNFYKTHNNQPLSSDLLGISGDATTIYISEYLTRKTKRLFHLAKDWAKSHNYKYCWASNGHD